MAHQTNGNNGGSTATAERYEIRLVKIDGRDESVIESREIPKDKLEAQVAQLPDREAMSLVNANVFAPINIAAALNVLSDNSAAGALADQYAPGQQGI
jgi:hypothetical protein